MLKEQKINSIILIPVLALFILLNLVLNKETIGITEVNLVTPVYADTVGTVGVGGGSGSTGAVGGNQADNGGGAAPGGGS